MTRRTTGNNSVRTVLPSLRAIVARAASAGQTRVAGVRGLAAACHCSVTTCRKVLAILRAQGECVVVPGGGTFLPLATSAALKSQPAEPAPAPPVKRWVAVRDQLSSDILAARYQGGSVLPDAKMLAARYATSHAVLCTALRSLEKDGRLSRNGHRYRVPQPRYQAGATVVLVAHADSMVELIGFTPRSEEFVNHLEMRCQQSGMRLLLLPFRDAILWTPRAQAVFDASAARPVVGVLVLTLALSSDDVSRLAINLHRTGIPSSFLDELGNHAMPDLVMRNPQFQYFVTAFTKTAGTAVGSLLLQYGHRHAAFFCRTSDDPVGRIRSEGIGEYLEHNGRGDIRMFAPGPQEQREQADAALAKAVARLAASLGSSPRNPHRMRFEREAYTLAALDAVRTRLHPHLAAALARREITAWVAENDTMAFLLLDFLESRSISVPKHISVVGFDNVMGSVCADLTSYSFNMPAIADAMIGHVLGVPRKTARQKKPVIEVPGLIVERGSCGAARLPRHT